MKQLNRWVYAIVGVIVLLFAGLVYAWSVLSTPIAAEFTSWTKAQLSLTFTIVMILFCIGSLLCGLLSGKLSAKMSVRIGAVLVTMNTAYKIHEAEYLLRQSDTHTLILEKGWRDSDYQQIINELCPELVKTRTGAPLHSHQSVGIEKIQFSRHCYILLTVRVQRP